MMSANREKQWKAFAHELAMAVAESDIPDVLRDIEAPGGIDARTWLERRLEKRRNGYV